MAEVLGWDEATTAAEVEIYRERVAAERRSQEQPDDLAADLERTSAPDVLAAGWGPGGGFPSLSVTLRNVRRVMIRPLLGALALLAFAAPAASASDAEIFATNNTAVITDPGDPRLKDNLKDFARQVERIIDDGGGEARGSELLDGVFSSDGVTTFERSREFDVDRVSADELHTIADTIRARFKQQSVLTFDKLPPARSASTACCSTCRA